MTNLTKDCLVCPDVSEHNPVLTTAFHGDFLIVRVTFGAGWRDLNFLQNANAIAKLYGKTLKGVILYHVYTSDDVTAQYKALWAAVGPKVPDWLCGIMIDVERWAGTTYALNGDHSAQINRLAGMHAAKMGSWDSVILYGNRYDYAELAPRKDRRLRCIVAGYTDNIDLSVVGNAFGQQYTDGSTRWPVPRKQGKALRRATLPFGAVDHNVFPGIRDGAAMAAFLRPDKRVKPTPKPSTPPVVVKPTPTPAPTAHTVALSIDGKVVYSKVLS